MSVIKDILYELNPLPLSVLQTLSPWSFLGELHILLSSIFYGLRRISKDLLKLMRYYNKKLSFWKKIFYFFLLFLTFFIYFYIQNSNFAKLYTIFLILFLILNNFEQRKEGELSSYSVFNKDFVSLPGTMDVKDVENNIYNRFETNQAGDGLENEASSGKNRIFNDALLTSVVSDKEDEEEEGEGEEEEEEEEGRDKEKSSKSSKSKNKKKSKGKGKAGQSSPSNLTLKFVRSEEIQRETNLLYYRVRDRALHLQEVEEENRREAIKLREAEAEAEAEADEEADEQEQDEEEEEE